MPKGKRDEQLRAEGWTRRFVADEPRLSEAVRMYQSLGFEVHLEPLMDLEPDEECGECRVCFEGQPRDKYMVIYTRPRPSGEGAGEGEVPEEDLY